MHKEILDMFTTDSNFQTKLVSVVVEERKTSSLFISKLLPAILPSPVFVLNFNFQNWLIEKLVQWIEWNSKIALPVTRPSSLVNPRTPCILICVCESWWKRSHCYIRIHCSVGNYLCLLKIKDLNRGTDNFRYDMIRCEADLDYYLSKWLVEEIILHNERRWVLVFSSLDLNCEWKFNSQFISVLN